MSRHNLLACIWWADGRRRSEPVRLPASPSPTALCEHDGCPWFSTAPTEQQQISAFIVHHTNHHQEG